MNIQRHFVSANRYAFDFDICSYEKGFAQIDTSQDASYFGTWTNPTELKTISYTEGDIVIKQADSIQEYVQDLKELKQWNESMGYFCMIDPGFDPDMKQKFIQLGLQCLLHQGEKTC